MHRGKYILLFAAVTIACVLGAGVLRNGARGQEGEDDQNLDARVASELEAMGAGNEAVWRTGRRLESLGVGAVPGLLSRWKTLLPRPRTAVGWALSRLGFQADVFKKTLDDLQAEKDLEISVLLAELLRGVAKKEDGEAMERILDSVFEPRVKIPLCQGLFEASGSLRGKKELKALLDSEDELVKVAAAMALAEMGDVEPGKRILRRLEEEPTERGRLARSLLREYDLKRMIERADFTASGEGKEHFKDPVLDEMRRTIQKFYVDAPKTVFSRLAGAAASGILDHLDPYSHYIGASLMKEVNKIVAGERVGVGLVLGFSPKHPDGEDFRRVPVVVAPIWGSPAAKAGIRPLDEVWEINGESAFGKNLLELEVLLSGKPGTRVTLSLYHKGWFRERKVGLVRSKTVPPAVLSERLPGGLLLVKLPRMAVESGPALAGEVEASAKNGVKGILLDLRNNPGGSLEAAVEIAGAFLPKGTAVCSIRGRNPEAGPDRELKTGSDGPSELPLVVLVNEGTARSAEVLAGALHGHGRARLVGEETFGFARIQRRFLLESTANLTAVRMTVAVVHLPGLGNFDGKGLKPDLQVPVPRLEIWRHDEIAKILEKGFVDQYLDEHFEANLELFRELAKADGRKPEAYPGFDAWFRSTKTKADKDDLRRILREGIRARLAERAAKPLLSDLQEDGTLLASVKALAQTAGIDLSSFPEYASLTKKK